MAKLNNLDLSGSLGGGAISAILNLIYPIGSYFISSSEEFNTLEKVQNHFGGNWEQVVDRFLVGAGNLYTVGATGGSKDAIVVAHKHSTTSAGSHTHSISITNRSGDYMSESSKGTAWRGSSGTSFSTGSAGSHTHTVEETGVDGTNKNLPPYLAVYMYKRIG